MLDYMYMDIIKNTWFIVFLIIFICTCIKSFLFIWLMNKNMIIDILLNRPEQYKPLQCGDRL